MINSFFEIVNHSGFDYKDYLEQLNLIRIFEPIFKEYPDLELAKKIIRWIAYSHSIESNKISVGGNRRKECKTIFDELEIPKEYYDDLILLRNDAVIKSVQLWMEFQDSRQIEFLFTLHNAYTQQQSAALQDIKKSTGETDFDQKMRCVEHMTELKKMIKDAESELQQNNEKLKEAYSDVKKSTKKNTVGVENFV